MGSCPAARASVAAAPVQSLARAAADPRLATEVKAQAAAAHKPAARKVRRLAEVDRLAQADMAPACALARRPGAAEPTSWPARSAPKPCFFGPCSQKPWPHRGTFAAGSS